MLLLPATPDVIRGFISAVEAAPEELSAIGNVMPAPPMPFVPEDKHGELVLMATLVFVGPAEEADAVLAPVRALAEPIVDMVQPTAYPELFPPEQEGYHPVVDVRTMFLDGVDEEAAGRIVAELTARKSAMAVVQLRPLGGAMARVSADETAFAHRDRKLMSSVVAMHDPGDESGAHLSWVDELTAALRGDGKGAYVGFLADEGEERVREAYPDATWERLRKVKGTYDPDNLFRLNQNIPPAT
jgi:hypothetical protein